MSRTHTNWSQVWLPRERGLPPELNWTIYGLVVSGAALVLSSIYSFVHFAASVVDQQVFEKRNRPCNMKQSLKAPQMETSERS